MEKCNILLSSVGRRSYLVEYFRQELQGRGRVIAANSDALTTAMQLADKSYVTPLIYSAEYIPTLLKICEDEQIDMLIPLFDIDLPVLARHKKEFEQIGVTMVVSELSAVEICNDKLHMIEFLQELELPTVYTDICFDEMGMRQKFSEGKRFLVKPRRGMGSLSVFLAENVPELEVFFKKAKRELQGSYLRFEAKQDEEHSVIIQELLSGTEYGLDIINDLQGKYVTTIVRQKLAMRAGETDMAELIDHPKLQELGRIISMGLGHIGNLDVDVIESDGKFYVIDMNARFGGGYPFSHASGVNLVRALILWQQKEVVSESLFVPRFGEVFAKNITIERLK